MHFAEAEKVAEMRLRIRPNRLSSAVLIKGTEISNPHNKARQNKKGGGVPVMAQIWLTYGQIGEFFFVPYGDGARFGDQIQLDSPPQPRRSDTGRIAPEFDD